MARITTTNPKNGERLRDYAYLDERATRAAVGAAREVYGAWREVPLAARLRAVAALGSRFVEESAALGRLATDEMGKPLKQAVGEVEKCATACRYYAEEAPKILAAEPVTLSGSNARAMIAYEPIGPILCIMPWNFPYWQVVRFAVPALAAGNTVLLKHADNTAGVALEIERLFREAGFPEKAFQTLLVDHDGIKPVIADPAVRAVSLTGSERAGASVAAQAGAALKKSVLELGGSDAYIVLKDADVEQAAQVCVEARLVNNGQSCVAAKRFIVDAAVYDEFRDAFVARVRKKVMTDPLDPRCDVGPLAKPSILEGVAEQVEKTLKQGAKALVGGKRGDGPGYWYPPTVLDGVTPGMAAFEEEVFGPVAALVRAKDEDDALTLANRSRYGLGGAIFSKDVAKAEALARHRLEAGFCVVNGQVASDPRLPFGGVKLSGYGRELSWVGMREFVNVKTVVVHGG